MKITSLPQQVMARLLQLEGDARNAQSQARDAAAAVSNARASLYTLIEREDLERVEANLPRLIQDAEAASNMYSSLSSTVERCRRWLDNLPDSTVLDLYVPRATEGDPASALKATREKMAAAVKERDMLDKIPIPSDDIEARVRDHVAELAMRARPYVRGVARGAKLSVWWPPTPSSVISNTQNWPKTDCNALMMFALLQPDELAQVILNQIESEANQTLPIAERQQRIAELTDEIAELERQASDLVYALLQSGDPRTYQNAPPDAVLGVIEKTRERVAA